MQNTFKFALRAPEVESASGAAETADSPHPQASDTAKSDASTVGNQAILERLLLMAQRYRKEMNPREATELFWWLVEEYPGTPQAGAARLELQELAEAYERAGNQHTARSIYQRLLDLDR